MKIFLNDPIIARPSAFVSVHPWFCMTFYFKWKSIQTNLELGTHSLRQWAHGVLHMLLWRWLPSHIPFLWYFTFHLPPTFKTVKGAVELNYVYVIIMSNWGITEVSASFFMVLTFLLWIVERFSLPDLQMKPFRSEMYKSW